MINLLEDITEFEVTELVKEKSKLTKEEWREWTKSVWPIANTTNKHHPAVFPVEIPFRLIKMFSYWGETVLDPFCGVGHSGIAALQAGRNFIGYDINDNYTQIAKESLNSTPTESKFYKIINGDSRKMIHVPDNSIGTITTSPPYWNKADYGQYEGNIGNIAEYDTFLNNTQTVLKECYRVLKPGRRLSIITANVNQNTTEGLLTFPIAADLIKKAQELGFLLVNEIIWSKDGTGGRWGSAGKQRPIFGSYPYPPNFLFKTLHEYIIILKKPEFSRKSSAPKYEDLFTGKPHNQP
jgi:site-specific DNA-methyltransferase (adenine-specific)